ncbi:MAG: hypothetical protein HZC15_00775 [Candidatus Omnitrophica bacterium]|nr:hypothetical protein [Candidatus Omnitrophota bacterium]
MTKELFFNRDAYLQILEKRISGLKEGYRQNIAIIGDELVGKTSIIFKFLNKFYDNKTIILYVEARHESSASFANRFIGILLYNFLANSNMYLKEDLDYLKQKASKFIPKTTEKIENILNSLKKRKRKDVFTELLSLCESINQETGKFCVVVFDEFQNLENIGFGDIYFEWSKLLLVQKNTMHIIISSQKHKTKAILAKQLSLLFGNFEIINVEPFDAKTSEKYIEEKLKLTKPGVSQGIKNFIIHFTGGFPFYLEVLTDAIIKSSQENLAQILEHLLFDISGILNQRFSNFMKRFQDIPDANEYISILYLVSNGQNKIKDIAHLLKKQQAELANKVNRLIEMDVISKNGDFLKICDRVFGFWIKFVYHGKLNSLTFDAKNQKQIFRNSIDAAIQDFLVHTQKPVMQRLMELLHMFEDQTIQLEKKKIRLHQFREIKPLEFTHSSLKHGLLGRSNESLWIMALKTESITEEDITEFVKECKKFRHKLQRNIIITLNDIDMNTRLKALEEKVWAWDIESLNQIFDLFSRPGVIA